MRVGDYVRLNNSVYDIKVINKIAEINKDTILTENDGSIYEGEYAKEEILKVSPNIIDLIEAGDYIDGERVEKNKYGELYTGYVYCGGDIGRTEESYTLFLKEMDEDDIITVVTREQFERMEYMINTKKEAVKEDPEDKKIKKINVKNNELVTEWKNGSSYSYPLLNENLIIVDKINEIIDKINKD